MSYMSRYRDWQLNDYFDEETKAELESIEGDEQEIEDRFYKDLEFGTGGMRGKMGAGTNRMNKYIVRRATQGLANYIVNYYDDAAGPRSVVISYDSRHNSPQFAEEAALVLAGNGIKAYLFEELKPTPELSYAVRHFEAKAGIMITASHNPPEYNGYKVYDPDGCQLVPEKAGKVTAEIAEIDDFGLIRRLDKEEAMARDLLEYIGEEVERAYFKEVKKVLPDLELAREEGGKLSIIYSPLHGTGNKPVRDFLSELGFSELMVVQRQAEPDPNFSTVKSPNPEEEQAFTLALEMAEDYPADLIMATDPDCDRLGVLVRCAEDQGCSGVELEGEEGVEEETEAEAGKEAEASSQAPVYQALTGNEIGVLFADYLLLRLQEKGKLPELGTIIKTIVSTEMVNSIAEEFGVEVIDVLTGFKFIGEKIKLFEETEEEFIFGFEESYGYLTGTYARDKDALNAAALMATMALYYQEEENKSLLTRLAELRAEHGYYLEDLKAIRLEGKEGQEKIDHTLEELRENNPPEIASKEVEVFKDYLNQEEIDCKSGECSAIDLPTSNVLQFRLSDESLITVRPSGTEPKLKIYFAVRGSRKADAEERMKELQEEFMDLVYQILDDK